MKNYGFVKPIIEKNHYIFGSSSSLPKIVLQNDGQWDEFLPEYEAQSDKYETYGCADWGTQNALETLEKKIYGGNPNYSERFTYNLNHIREPGSDPHAISESIRKYGVISDSSLPMPDTYEEFIQPDPMCEPYLTQGRAWLNRFSYGHEWLFNEVSLEERTKLMKEALRYSPLGISVTAWFQNSDGLYVDNGIPNTHWCVCYGYDSSGNWKIFDSYDQSKKLLVPDHNFQCAKRYQLLTVNPQKLGFFKRLFSCQG